MDPQGSGTIAVRHSMPRWPGIQGLRGLAVAAVLLYHHDDRWLPGGFLGVSLFFTLSGFLITTLLLREREARGRTSLSGFWIRRLRRLMPVALLGLALAAAVAPFVATDRELARIGGDVVAAALDVANWRFAGAPQGYGEAFAVASPVTHYWSLAIEEQFYVVFPIVVLLAATRRRLGVVLVLAGAASVVAQLAIDDPNRVYLGSDTRAFELIAGALLAVWWARGRRPRPGVLDAAALPVALGVLATWRLVDLGSPRLYDGGFVAVAASSTVLVLAAIAGDHVPRVLAWRPLTALGDHSYGLYVFHFPLYLLLSPERVGVDGVTLLAIRIAAATLVTLAVHGLVEHPVRFQGALPGWHGRGAAVTGIAALVVVGVALPEVPSRTDRSDFGALVASGDDPTVLTVPTGDEPSPTVLPATATATVTVDGGMAPDVTVPVASPTTEAAAGDPPRILVVGDSTALANGTAMQAWGLRTGRLHAGVVAVAGCALLHDGEVIYRAGWRTRPDEGCAELVDTAVAVASDTEPDAVVVFVGSAQLADWVLAGSSEPMSFGDPAYEARYVETAHAAFDRLESIGVPVLLTTVPVPAWVPEATNAEAGRMGTGVPYMNDPVRTARLNELTAEVAAAHPLVQLVSYAEHLAGPDGVVDAETRPDGLHVSTAAMERILESWFEADLAAAYRAAIDANDLGSRSITWTNVG